MYILGPIYTSIINVLNMTTKRPIQVRLNPIYTSIINVLNRTTKRLIDVRLNPIYTSIINVLNMTFSLTSIGLVVVMFNTLIIDVYIGFSLS
jgi:hypothetical protein